MNYDQIDPSKTVLKIKPEPQDFGEIERASTEAQQPTLTGRTTIEAPRRTD